MQRKDCKKTFRQLQNMVYFLLFTAARALPLLIRINNISDGPPTNSVCKNLENNKIKEADCHRNRCSNPERISSFSFFSPQENIDNTVLATVESQHQSYYSFNTVRGHEQVLEGNLSKPNGSFVAGYEKQRIEEQRRAGKSEMYLHGHSKQNRN
jgi:hypothetical protein